MKSIHLRRSITIILGALFAIIIMYLWYTQFYIKSREKQLIQTHYRVLDQMGENLATKVYSYQKNAENLQQAIVENETELLRLYKSQENISDIPVAAKTQGKFIDNRLKSINMQIEFAENFDVNYKKIYNADFKYIKKFDPTIKEPIFIQNDSMIFIVADYWFYLPVKLLLKNIDRKDIFEKNLILDTSSIIYSSFTSNLRLELIEASKLSTGNDKNLFNLSPEFKNDTLYLPGTGKNKAAILHSSKSYNVTLSDGDYKLFLKPVKIGNLNWFIGGLVNQRDFQRSKQSIAPGFIIVLSIILLLIMVSLPFVKLKVMSETEMLGTGTVIYAGLAFFLGASFLILFLFFKAYNLSSLDDADNKLVALSDSISAAMTRELESVYRQLDASDKLFASTTGKASLDSNANYITDVLVNETIWKPQHYKYFDYIIWLDSTGQAVAQVTPFYMKEKLFRYDEREYFTKHDEWFWHYDNPGEISKFRVESIVSTTSGEYKVAVSRPSYDHNHIIAMTGRLSSLIDPIIPSGFKFCIIDETGKVWFHSNKYQNLGENFINECNDDRHLRAALYANVSKSLNVSYFNDMHRVYFKPVYGMPLYLVTMYDLQAEYSYQAQVFITTVVFICFLFLYMLIQVIIILVMKHLFYQDLTATKFELDIINFRKNKSSDYRYLIIVFAIAFIIYCASMPWLPDMAAIITIYNIIVVLFVILFDHLYDFPGKARALSIFKSVNNFLMVGVFFLLHYLAGNFKVFDWQNISISFISLLLSLVIIIRYRKSNKFSAYIFHWTSHNKITKRLEKPEIAYSWLIFFMIIMFGIAPILKFFDISADLENNIHTRFRQVELASDKEHRNNEFAKYYERVKNCTNDEFCNEVYSGRINEGIYTGFWNETRWNIENKPAQNKKTVEDFESLVNTFRPVYKDNFSVFSKYLLYDTVENRPFKWMSTRNELTLEYESRTENHKEEVPVKVELSSEVIKANIFKPIWKPLQYKTNKEFNRFGFLKIISLYSILIFILYFVFRLVHFTTIKAFGASLIEDYTVSNFNTRITDHIRDNLPVMVVNPSGFLGFKELSDNISTKFKTTDFNWAYPKLNEFSGPLLVRGLFMDYKDPRILQEKIDKIFECLQLSGKLIFLLDISPEIVMNYYKEKVETTKKPDPKAEKDEISPDLFKTHESLNELIKRVILLFVPVKYNPEDDNPVKSGQSLIRQIEDASTPEEMIALDLSAGNYLGTLEIPVKRHLGSLADQSFDLIKMKKILIKRISEMAGKYYRNLVENCSPEEKVVLLDLALDSIANVKNRHAIIKLLRRGLIIQGEDSVELMNCSFRAFLLSNYTRHDNEHYRKAIGIKPGKWTGYKYALWLVIVALFIFIFISNQEFLQNLNKMFIALGASIGGITTLLGIMGKKVRES